MATTTKSTRKKPSRASAAAKVTKTSKTTSASARAKKDVQTKKAASSKDDSASAKVKSSVKTATLTPLEKLRNLNVSNAFLYVVFSAFVTFFATTAAVAVTLGISARDEFASRNNTVLGPSHEVLYNIEPKYVLVASLLVSAIGSILLATKLRKRYEATLTNGTSGFRWLTVGLSAALLLTFVQLLANVQDAATLKMSGALILVTTLLAWIAERDNVGAARPKWLAFVFSLFTGVVAWLPVIGTFIGTTLYGEERFAWYVYAIALVTLLGFTGFALRQYRQLKAGSRANDYVLVEAGYLRIDMITKLAVVILVLVAFN